MKSTNPYWKNLEISRFTAQEFGILNSITQKPQTLQIHNEARGMFGKHMLMGLKYTCLEPNLTKNSVSVQLKMAQLA